jgi:hypothetical protein
MACADGSIGSVAGGEDKMTKQAITGVARNGGSGGVELGDCEVEAIVCGLHARGMDGDER